MKKIYAIFAVLLMAVMFNGCATAIKGAVQSSNRPGSPFPKVEDLNTVFVEGRVLLTGDDFGAVSEESNLETVLWGKFLRDLRPSVETETQTTAKRSTGNSEYNTNYSEWVTLTANGLLNSNIAIVSRKWVEKRKEGTYYWVRISGNRKELTDYLDKQAKAEKRENSKEVREERNFIKGLAKLTNR